MPAEQKIPFEVTRARRAGARLAAVQALYEMEQTGNSAKATISAGFFPAVLLRVYPEGESLSKRSLHGSVLSCRLC